MPEQQQIGGAAADRELLPGGLGKSTFAVGNDPPLAIHGEGCILWDDSGHEVIDVNNNFTSLVHGHAHPDITKAACAAMARGASFGLPNPSELRHARELMKRIPHLDQVRYTNSGTEAMMLALRLARAYTGRDACVLVRNAYHGTSDALLPTGAPRYVRGIPASVLHDIIPLPVNDEGQLVEVIERSPERIAALVLDFMPNRAGLVPLSDEYIAKAQHLCSRHGIVLIADEVVSFRLRYEGMAVARGVRPDLMAVGKLIGGGLPVGAVIGRAQIMAELDPASPTALEHAGTFIANPVTMEAGTKSLELLGTAEIARINDLGDCARLDLGQRIGPFGWHVRGSGSLLRPFPDSHPSTFAELQRRLWWESYRRGVLLTQNSLVALSTAIDENVMASVVSKVAEAVEAVSTSRGLLATQLS